MVLEPIQVFASFEAHSSDFNFSVPAKHVTPSFAYERAPLEKDILHQREGYVDFLYDLLMRDSNGHIPNRPLVVSKFAYILSKTIDENVFLSYVRHKFYIYDRVIPLKDYSNFSLEEVFRRNENSAFITDPLEAGMPQAKEGVSPHPLIISRNTEQFKVVDFNPNRVQLITDFKTGKFLVYTDSYEKHWKVFINGQEQKLYRANMAFKGVWLPAGKNEVAFQYSIMGEKELYLLILFLNFLFLIYFLKRICIK
jgi:hypothetical protein